MASAIAWRKTSSALRHAGNFVLTAERYGDIGLAAGDAPHGAAQQRQTADDAAADIKPRNQAGGGERRDAQMMRTIRPNAICDIARADKRLRRNALPLDQTFDGGAQPGRLAERRLIDLLRILLVVEFAGALAQ